MADLKKRLANNVPGDFFVDATCINCDTCRQLAPTVFGEAHGRSFVKTQPPNTSCTRDATRALLACPTGSIGTQGTNIAKEVMADFPLPIADGIYYCGFNSPKSFGGNSYLIVHPQGNWLIDSPKYLPHLKEKFHQLGGIANIFLTHRDDVADARQYADEFGAKRIIHKEDAQAQMDAEVFLQGTEPRKLHDEFEVIPTPGHTRGHCVLLYKDKFLFTGDHMAWDRDTTSLESWPDVCWYDWEKQKDSVRLLSNYSFEWVLPGHGQSIQLSKQEMSAELADLIRRLDEI